ncbi:TRAP transporter permease [Aestuariispira insulae]|uniref:TRAP transporter 4TM/12TM fusion protein n=1 Tax=Aestuariispira insulae TaxID=1461337 RepID=A0A3D9HS43_9PROT|nr:TRAP transporter fused permease subunit [Aestuariispira insulae]RED52312.1 TRAP transporter 4TM/12TM fusion protein [Aestuariispira insulae]
MTDIQENSPPGPSEGDSGSLLRSRDPWVDRPVYWIGVGISLLHIYFNTLGTLSTLWQSALHFALLGLLCAVTFPLIKGSKSKALLLLDVAFGLLIAFAALFMIWREDAIYDRGVHLSTSEWIMGALLILGAIEYTRRTTGWIVPAIIITALSYVTLWGGWLDNVFKFTGLSNETVMFRSVYGDDALFGGIARISSTVVFMFILFGAFLVKSGAGDFIVALARAVAGRMVGGPGLVAVLSSGLTGTISGSAVANTVSTGVITIPLMKKAGFPKKFAAGVEAASSTGGQLMPPIMGAGAFVMANYTQISYTHIVAVAALPALLYFLSVAFFVRIEAKRQGLTATADDGPKLMTVLKQGGAVFLVPIMVLIGLLIAGFTPTYAAAIGILAVIVCSWLTPNKMTPRRILDALSEGAQSMVTTAVLLVAVGLVVNVVAMTGVGNVLSQMIQVWAGGNMVIAIILIALASLVLGMGLPVTAAYIVLATLSAPALYNLMADSYLVDALASGAAIPEAAKMMILLAQPDMAASLESGLSPDQAGILIASLRETSPEVLQLMQEQTLAPALLTTALLSAHMIIFWLSQDSNVTPPVCLTAFAAATIAKSPQMATGVTAWKIAKGLYIVPVLFAYTPFLGGEPLVALEIFAFAVVGVYALAGALQGCMEYPMGWIERAIAAAFGVALLWPMDTLSHLGIATGFLVFFAISLKRGRMAKAVTR